jgi:hypothetical protein
MPHNPLSKEPPQSARDMTSDDVFFTLSRAVHGCSDWHFWPLSEDSQAMIVLTQWNRAAFQRIKQAAEVCVCFRRAE